MKTVFAKQVKINFTYVIGRDGDQHEIIAKHLNQSSIPIKLWCFSCSSCCSSLNSQKNEAGQHNNNNHYGSFFITSSEDVKSQESHKIAVDHH